ncbi:TIGR04086 family membrane protein [Caproiciproducens sp. NJN-50]|uniref:TIGR04086 family membrane protein n=1 Tax=Acutalibacteraceae TaxID=3082771 RepID=UPI000FFE3169|nr:MULTISPECIES: TIGR04086 family membrane protein [Acutalibacteraceae]QAT49698.1 TIGR04086 family membrane protein [Caproiciproducens sp. NJN-50]
MMKSSKSIRQKPVLDAIRAIVIGSVAGALICAVFLGVSALVFVSAESIPQGLLSPLVIAVSVLSAFAAGYIAARISKKRGLLFGAASGMLLFALFLFSGLAVSNKAVEPAQCGIRLLVMVLSGAIGGVLAVSRKTKLKRK